MSTEEAREYVQAGLSRKKEARAEREREEELDAFEEEMISTCNRHSADSKKDRTEQESRESTRALKAAKRAEMRRKDEAAERACSRYGYACVAILLTCCVTPLPFYGAAALIAGLAVFPTVYIVKLYGLLDGESA